MRSGWINRWWRVGLGAAVSVSAIVAPGRVGPGLGHAFAAPIESEIPAASLSSGEALRVHVPGSEGGKTVIGQLTVARASEPGYVTAYGCDDGVPLDADGTVGRSDLNYDGRVAHSWSNRLIVEADDDGDVCFYTLTSLEMIVDVNAVSFDTGITSFPNRRTDTRDGGEPIEAGGVLRLSVPEAAGAKTVIGQLTSARATEPGFVTAYGCDRGLPRNEEGEIDRSDLNYDGRVTPSRSNRLIVEADDDGDVCFYTPERVDLVVDLNGVADSGITSFPNRRTDTRSGAGPVAAGGVLRVNVPEASGAQTVIGQLTAAGVREPGFVTAYGCDDGLPRNEVGAIDRSDLNYDQRVSSSRSNRLVVQADADGDVCFSTLREVDLVIDINGVSDTGITSFPNRRTDTRFGIEPGAVEVPLDADGVPVWPPYNPLPPVEGVAALTGFAADQTVTNRPIIAVKVDNYRRARPHIGLDRADAVLEVNVEGVSRFIALFHSQPPPTIGPVRSSANHRPRSARRDEPADLRLLGGQPRRGAMDRFRRYIGPARRPERTTERVLRTGPRPSRTPQPRPRLGVCSRRCRQCRPGPATLEHRPRLGRAGRGEVDAGRHVPGADGRRPGAVDVG